MKSKESKIAWPRIYTLHSQKGGVGKTSVAIAIAGFASIFHKKNALIIDADLTGVSLADLPNWVSDNQKKIKYFNDLILAKPNEFLKYTRTSSTKSKTQIRGKLKPFYQKIPNYERIFYMPGSPFFGDLRKIIPLISQEDYLQFFRQRIEDIIITAFYDHFDSIIIDHPPGLFGVSTASLNIILSQITKENSYIGKDVVSKAIFLTTADTFDYKALIPSISFILTENNNFQYLNPDDPRIDLIINKAGTSKSRKDLVLEQKEIFKNISGKFPDERKVHPDLISYLPKRAERVGALACEYVEDFDLKNILETIVRLKNKDAEDGMERWCAQIGKLVGLYKGSF